MTSSQAKRTNLLTKHLSDHILVLDGAMGTAIQATHPTVKDYGGEMYEGCNEHLNISAPHIIRGISESYLKAGADIIESNTFSATPLVLSEYGLCEKAYDLNFAGAKLAKDLALQYSTNDKPRFVAGSIGPTTKAISVTGGITFSELANHYYEQLRGLYDGGVDYLLIETCYDTRNIKACLFAADRLFANKEPIPIAVSVTIEPTGTMLAGQSIEAALASLAHRKLLYFGINCATGPEFMTDPIRSLAELSPFAVSCMPNAGLPDENGCYLETPEMMVSVLSRFVENRWVNVLGGCCGTHAEHVKAIAALAKHGKPRTQRSHRGSYLSGIDLVDITDEKRPILVGERTNVIGSRKFKDLIVQEKFGQAAELARSAVRSGAEIIDVCMANPERNELSDMERLLQELTKKIRAPIMIDSTDEKVIEMALTYCQGKSIINSINLEDGEKRFHKILPLVKQFGASVVVGTIDDDPNQGMGVSCERKLEIAHKEYKLLSEKYDLQACDIFWDPLVFPCATGDAKYEGSAAQTIKAITELKKTFPGTKTVLGISNISFGLPPQGREVLNSVFLHECVEAGLDLAIVNAEKLERYATIADDERQLAQNLIYKSQPDAISKFASYFRDKKSEEKAEVNKLPLMERLSRYIIEGSRDGLIDDLKEALKTLRPLEIINGPLMAGMDEVGKLFNANKLIVAEVLQSAESMKAAVNYLESFIEKTESPKKPKVLLATVKGDVHDIGKNLVEIILSNNGFEVINLGIKVPPEALLAAIKQHQPDLIGLSGLLVKSAVQMAVTADDLTKSGATPPMLVGGAALTSNYVDKTIATSYGGFVAYASDAMNGLELAKKIVTPNSFDELKAHVAKERTEALELVKPAPTREEHGRSTLISVIDRPSVPPDWERHILKNTPIEQIWKFINPMMLYGRHLGIRGEIIRSLGSDISNHRQITEIAKRDPKTADILQAVEEVKNEFKNTELMAPSAIYQFFRAVSNENSIVIHVPGRSAPVIISFSRQRTKNGLCLADYVSPAPVPNASAMPHAVKQNELVDSIGMFIVTVGKGVRQMSERLKNAGSYLRSHVLQVLPLESAEAYAELIHSQIRKAWGFADPVDMTMLDRFQAKYRGKRYSFGYPACPRLEDQRLLFDCLNPGEIGVELTEGFMMDPEASVSALVFHHPQASYFSVGSHV